MSVTGYGTGKRELSVQERSKAAAVEPRETVEWLQRFASANAKNAKIAAVMPMLRSVVRDGAAFSVPDQVYDAVTVGINTPESAMHMCAGVLRKIFWLMVNFRLADIVREAMVGAGSGAAGAGPVVSVIDTAKHNDVRAMYASCYASLINYWFGWTHNGIGFVKTRENPSNKDPIAVIRFVAYMRRMDELLGGNVPPAFMQVLEDMLETLLDFNSALTGVMFDATKGASFLVAKTTQNQYLFRDNYAILEGHRGKGKDARFMDRTSKTVLTELLAVSYPLLDVVLDEFRDRVAARDSWSDPKGTISLISKWVAQQTLWSWGGVYGDMEEEVMLNSVPGMEKVNKNNLFFYLSKETLSVAASAATAAIDNQKMVEKAQRALWLGLAWVSQREELALWIKEMWPEAFSGSIPASVDTSNAWAGKPEEAHAYSVSFRAYCHPVFAAHVINVVADAAGTTAANALIDLFGNSWSGIEKERDALPDTQVIGYRPHLLWLRTVEMPAKATDRVRRYSEYRRQLDSPCPMNSGMGRKDSWGCVCNVFSYDDDLGLERNKINLQQEIAAAQARINQLLAEKRRIIEAQKGGVAMIEVEGRQTPCAEAYSDLMQRMQALQGQHSQLLAAAKQNEELQKQMTRTMNSCTTSLHDALEANRSHGDHAKRLARLRTLLFADDDAAMEGTVSELASLRGRLRETIGEPTATSARIMNVVNAMKEDSAELKTLEEEERKNQPAKAEDARARAALEVLAAEVRAITKLEDLKEVSSDIASKYAELEELKTRAALDAKVRQASDKSIQDQLAACIARAEKAESDLGQLRKDKLESETALRESKDAVQAQLDGLLQQQAPPTATAAATTPEEAKDKEKRLERLYAEFAVRVKLNICNKALEKLKSENAELVRKHGEALESLKRDFEEKLKTMKSIADCEAEKKDLTDTHAADIAALNSAHSTAMEDLKRAHREAVAALNQGVADSTSTQAQKDAAAASAKKKEIDDLTDAHATEVANLNRDHQAALSAKQAALDTLEAEAATLRQAKRDLDDCGPKLAQCLADKTRLETEAADLRSSTTDLRSSAAALQSQIVTLTAERDALNTACSGNASLAAQVSALQAQVNAKEAERAACAADLATATARVAALEAEVRDLTARLSMTEQELQMWKSGAPMPVIMPSTSNAPAASGSGSSSSQRVETAMPAALADTVRIGSRPEKVFSETVDAMALGTACGGDNGKGEMPAGCFETANVPCDVPEQVIKGTCSYGTIPVPLDINSVALTYSVLDPGSKVKLQLQSALFKYNRAAALIMGGSPVVLDRHLCPLKKLYDYDAIESASVAGALKVPNTQYSRYLDPQAGTVARTFFEMFHGRNGGLRSAEEAASVGVEIVHSPHALYKVNTGAFSGMYRAPKGETVHPARVHVHPGYAAGSDVYPLAGDVYARPGASPDMSALAQGLGLLKEAARHLVNATMIYIGIAFDAKLVRIPSTAIPAGAFAMLPRADVDAMLALAILFPRTVERQQVPDLGMDLDGFEKDDAGTAVSRARAATCEVLNNYSLESALTGDISLAAKTDPANRDSVMSEAAKRVAEIAMLAETMNK